MKLRAAPALLVALALTGCTAPAPAPDDGVLRATSGTTPTFTVGEAGTFAIDITGGTPPYRCALSSGAQLPAGLALAGCAITGAPAPLAAGTTKSLSPPFVVAVTDSAEPPASTNATLQVPISGPLWTFQARGGACAVDADCSLVLGVVEGLQPPYALSAFPLPPGLGFETTTGRLHGTPTEAGRYEIEVCAQSLVGMRACDDAIVDIAPAGGVDDEEDAAPPGPEPDDPEPVDDTPLGVTLYYATCSARSDGSGSEIRASGVASGLVGSTLVVQIHPVGSASAVPGAGIAMDAEWSLLDTPPGGFEPLANEASAPVAQRERGEVPEGSWSMSNAFVVLDESDADYRVVARAFGPDGGNGTVEEETVRCYASRTPARVAILSATCTLDSKTNIPPGAGGAQIAWSWTIRLSGNFTGPKDERFGLSVDQPYVRMPKSGGTLVAEWTGQPSRNVGNGDPGWTLHRAPSDPKSGNWSVMDLVVTHQDYEVYYADYATQWGVTAQVGQEVARSSFNCPK